MLVHVITMWMMKVSIMDVVDVPVVPNGGMTAAWAVHVAVVRVGRMCAVRHGLSSQKRAATTAESLCTLERRITG